MDPSNLPSTFYRVSIKAFVFDGRNRLLLCQARDGKWEPPGGGWEHNETIYKCLDREIEEELGIKPKSYGEIIVAYRGRNPRGYETIKIAVRTEIDIHDFKFGDLINAEYISKERLQNLEMSPDEAGIKKAIDKIWPK